MSKTFFVVIPYDPTIIQQKNWLAKFRSSKQTINSSSSDNFEEHKGQLQQRASVVEQGLTRVGLRVATLGTEELVELLFKLFNPGEVTPPINK